MGEPGRVLAEANVVEPRWPELCEDKKGSRWPESKADMAKSRCRRLLEGAGEPKKLLVITDGENTGPSLARPTEGIAKPAWPEALNGKARPRRKGSVAGRAGPN